MKKVYILLAVLFMLGCEQLPDDPDNAIVSGYIYKQAVAVESVWVDPVWEYVEWEFFDPAESIHVWVESDITSAVPYLGPDIDGYTNVNGFFSIPVYLGHTGVKDANGNIIGYEYNDYADVRVMVLQTVEPGGINYDFGGGITLGRGKEFRLYTIAIPWFN